jgi:hypothetical protein
MATTEKVLIMFDSAAVQPLFGQLANIFGRRWLALSIVSVYILGRATTIRGRLSPMRLEIGKECPEKRLDNVSGPGYICRVLT